MADRERNRPASSKYDPVKVKVWLTSDQSSNAHYFILSRYLVSRMLTVTKIPHLKAVKIAMELKKQLVDSEQLEITQGNLEETLFQIMEAYGFGEEYLARYKMVNKFLQQKRPLVILICGSPCSGKSTVAQLLATRFNLPNVVQTDIVHELINKASPNPMALWEKELDEDELISKFKHEAAQVRRAVTGDLMKAAKDGKSIIMEGAHLDPGLFLYEFGKYGTGHLLREGAKIANKPLSIPRQSYRRSSLELSTLSTIPIDSSSAATKEAVPAWDSVDQGGSSPDIPPSPERGSLLLPATSKPATLRGTPSFAFSSNGVGMRPEILFATTHMAATPMMVPSHHFSAPGNELVDSSMRQSPASEWLAALVLQDNGQDSPERDPSPVREHKIPVDCVAPSEPSEGVKTLNTTDKTASDGSILAPTPVPELPVTAGLGERLGERLESSKRIPGSKQRFLKALLTRFVRPPNPVTSLKVKPPLPARGTQEAAGNGALSSGEHETPARVVAGNLEPSPQGDQSSADQPRQKGSVGESDAIDSSAQPPQIASDNELGKEEGDNLSAGELDSNNPGGVPGEQPPEQRLARSSAGASRRQPQIGNAVPTRTSSRKNKQMGLSNLSRDSQRSIKKRPSFKERLKVSFQTPDVPQTVFGSIQDSSSGEEVSRVPEYLRLESDLTQTESLAFGFSEQYSEHDPSEGEQELHRQMKQNLQWSQRVMPSISQLRNAAQNAQDQTPLSPENTRDSSHFDATIQAETDLLMASQQPAQAVQAEENKPGGSQPKDANAATESSEQFSDGPNAPIFVLIVLCMTDRDRDMLVEQKISRCKARQRSKEEIAGCQQQVKSLELHLRSYSACHVPVLTTSLPQLSATANLLHDYLLDCISLQME